MIFFIENLIWILLAVPKVELLFPVSVFTIAWQNPDPRDSSCCFSFHDNNVISEPINEKKLESLIEKPTV
jgi:hypothetical protein